MRAYFDSSALVPLVVAEPASNICLRLWDAADLIITSSLAYVEVHAALAHAHRLGRLTEAARLNAITRFDARWKTLARVKPHDALLSQAAALAFSQSLRGYDAVHCATALSIAEPGLVAVAGDQNLLRAWSNLGLMTANTNG